MAYSLMIVGFIFIILPSLNNSSKKDGFLIKSFKYGAVFGFTVYGIYNATNMAIFEDYSLSIAVMDTAWGTFAYFCTTLLYLWLNNRN